MNFRREEGTKSAKFWAVRRSRPAEGRGGGGAGGDQKRKKQGAPTVFHFGLFLVVENQFLEPAKGVPGQGPNTLTRKRETSTRAKQKSKRQQKTAKHPAHTQHTPSTHNQHTKPTQHKTNTQNQHTQNHQPSTNHQPTTTPKKIWITPTKIWTTPNTHTQKPTTNTSAKNSVWAKFGVGQSRFGQRFWPKSAIPLKH